MGIKIEKVSKTLGNNRVLNNINLELKSGKLTALLGPSGSGKTTLLRVISGLEKADKGKVFVNDENIEKQKVSKRQVGLVFQHYALFKNMTVFDNIAFGLNVVNKKNRLGRNEIFKKVSNLLQLIHMEEFIDRYPNQLSGGQKQRVALARALAIEPKVLLLDEPFGALDAKVRKELRLWMRQLHSEIHLTTVFVTHDQEEAMEVADEVVVMSNGNIEQVGSPFEVYNNPNNLFVYDFLGFYNKFEGYVKKDGEIILESSPKSKSLYSRSHEIFITKFEDKISSIKAKIIHINYTGSLVKVELEKEDGNIIQVELPRTAIEKEKMKNDDIVFVRPKLVKIF
jgi:sulfate transport system ATP-binding protein